MSEANSRPTRDALDEATGDLRATRSRPVRRPN